MAASCSDRLRVGFATPDGRSDWVRWRRLIVILMMVIVVTEKCSAEESGIKDCTVYHFEKKRSLPPAIFFKNLTVGFPPDMYKETLKGIQIILRKIGGYPTFVTFSDDASKLQAECSQNGVTDTSSLSNFTSESPLDDWVHIPFSVRDGDLSIGQTKVCQSLPDGKKQFRISRISRSNDATNVVFNCKEGCPIYTNTTSLVKHNTRLNDTKIYMKRSKLNENATAQLSLVNCSLGRADCREIQTICVNFSTNISDWELQDVNLEVPDDIESNRAIFLNLTGSKGTSWSLNCDPRQYGSKDSTLSRLEKMKEEEIKPETDWKTVSIALPVAIIFLVIILVIATSGFLVMKKRLAPTEARDSQSGIQFSFSTEVTENSTGLEASARNANLENTILLKPSYPPPPVPIHTHSPPSPKSSSPPANHFSEEDPNYANPRDMMLPLMPSRRESSNYVEPFNSLASKPL